MEPPVGAATPIPPVHLVGAGPGDPGLITLRGQEALARAEVVIADRLVAPRLLASLPATTDLVVRGERRESPTQDEIVALMIMHARAGRRVVRLKGGDPFVFGRGAEEAQGLAAAGVPFVVVPGVTAAVAVPAYAGIPLTHRGSAGAVAFVTGHEADDKGGGTVDWDALARGATTLVLFMSVTHLPSVVRRLVAAGRAPSTPAAVIERGTTPRQRTVRGTLADIAERAAAAGVEPPALTVVGEVAGLGLSLDWFERRPLHGRRILWLGLDMEPFPDDAAAHLEASGVDVLWVPPLRVEEDPGALAAALARRYRYRWVALTSARAVPPLARALDAAGLDARALAGTKIAALPAAARWVRSLLGVRPDVVVEGGGDDLAQAVLAQGRPGPVLFPRADAGREELPDALRAAGYEVDAIAAYRTVPNDEALASLAAEHARAPFSAVAFGSPRGAEAFLAHAVPLDGVLVAALGETTAGALAGLGHVPQLVASRPSLPTLLVEICDALAARR